MLEGRTHATRTHVTLLRCRTGTSEDGAALQLDLWRKQEDTHDTAAADGGDAPRACVLWIHGGGWRAGSKSHIPACMLPVLAEGFMVASVGYRKSTTARFPACIHDCKMAVRFLRAESATLGVDPARIGVVGSSAGGHLAMLMAFADDALDGLHVRPCAWMSLCPCIRACTQEIAHILMTRWPARACGSVQPRAGYREYSRTKRSPYVRRND